MALDPIGKKPLARFRPGSRILSIGGYGCNMDCPYCQNHAISRSAPGPHPVGAEPGETTPGEVARRSAALAPQGNIGVAYTYNEPLIGYEFVYDCCKLIKGQGQSNVLVTNGMVCEGPLAELLGYVDAANVDLKCFDAGTYGRLGGDLPTVTSSIRACAAACHLEVTALIVPGMNDSVPEMEALSGFLAGIDPGIPLHVTRFFPRHRMSGAEATDLGLIYRLAEVARASLWHVYEGNC